MDEPTAIGSVNTNQPYPQKDSQILFSQDEIVTYKGIEFLIIDVQRYQGSTYDKPKEGQEKEHNFISFVRDTYLEYADLNVGGVVEGTIVFEQPVNDSSLTLNYYNNHVFDDHPAFQSK